MKKGDLVWFDMYYHKPSEYKGCHPRDYAVLAVVVEIDAWSSYGMRRPIEDEMPLYDSVDILVGDKIYNVPERSLILADKTVK